MGSWFGCNASFAILARSYYVHDLGFVQRLVVKVRGVVKKKKKLAGETNSNPVVG